jgi:hypothetical protein
VSTSKAERARPQFLPVTERSADYERCKNQKIEGADAKLSLKFLPSRPRIRKWMSDVLFDLRTHIDCDTWLFLFALCFNFSKSNNSADKQAVVVTAVDGPDGYPKHRK